MGPNIIPEYRKQFDFGVDRPTEPIGVILERLKSKILSMPPILARGVYDHLIGFKEDSDPPVVEWLPKALESFEIGELVMIKNLLDNKLEIQIRKY